MHEPRQNVEPAIALPDLFPQVRRLVPVRIRRIPGAVLKAPVEGKKKRLFAFHLRGHVDQVRIDGEMHQRALFEAEDRLGRIARRLVLLDRVMNILTGVRILQLGRGDRNPVQAEHQVERFFVFRRKVNLPRDGQAILSI